MPLYNREFVEMCMCGWDLQNSAIAMFDDIDRLFENCKIQNASLKFIQDQLEKVSALLTAIQCIARPSGSLHTFVEKEIRAAILAPWQMQVVSDLISQEMSHQALLQAQKPKDVQNPICPQ